MTIAVTGATGQLGRLVIEKLKTKGVETGIVALARSPEKAADLGVAVRPFDYDQPDDLPAALEGVEVLLLISSSEVGRRFAQHSKVIDAAKKAGVGRLVYTSILRADTSELSLAEEHKQTEAYLKASGLTHTILRNGWYFENYAGSVAAALEHGAVAGSAGEGRIAAATRADYAEAAVAALTTAEHENKTYELAGSNPFTLADLAREISEQTGKQVPFNNLPVADYAKLLEGAGLPKPVAEMFAAMEEPIARGALAGDDVDFKALVGRSTASLKDAVATMLDG